MGRRILLIEPPFYRLYKDTYSLTLFPLSLGYLAGAVRRHTDWEVRVYNADFSPKSETMQNEYVLGPGFDNYRKNLREPTAKVWGEIRKVIAEYRPHVIGVTAKSQNFTSARIVARLAKEIDGGTVVIVGGPHPSFVGAEVLEYPEFDLCVCGEGEATIVEILGAIAADRGFEAIAGVVHRQGGRAVRNPPRAFIEDLDSLSFPHELAPEVLHDYAKYPLPAFKSIMAIRGCPFDCFFCGSRFIWSRCPRFRSAENVAREIAGLRKKGVQTIDFEDDTFGINRKYIRELCEAIVEHSPGMRWTCELHAQLVDDDTISLLKSSGCYRMRMGVESGSNWMLKEIKKRITIEEAMAAARIIKKHGIELRVNFLVGFPQETEETLQATFNAMGRIKCDEIIYSIFTPYPGTESFQLCKQRGLIPADYDVSLYNHLSPANCFCAEIPRERFCPLALRGAKIADRKNRRSRLKRLLSPSNVWRIRELGAVESLKRAAQVLRGR
jgi:anaerobic magnesium-protoporphyrin IX monomethyl ester cyclase